MIAGGADPGLQGVDIHDLAPAMPTLRRQLVLAHLIMARKDRPFSPEQAAALARELARLIDQVHTERVGFEALADLAPEEFADHWQVTLDFLKIVTEMWPRQFWAKTVRLTLPNGGIYC